MFEAKGPPISLSMYTKFVVIVLCLVGKVCGGTKEGAETCYGKRSSNNRNLLLSCAVADPVRLKAK